MQNQNSIQDSLIFSLFIAGLVFMVGIIHYQENIDGFWSTPEVLAQAPSSLPTPVSNLPTDEQIYIQNILNQPENFYNPGTDELTPAQIMLKGGTKFLIGM